MAACRPTASGTPRAQVSRRCRAARGPARSGDRGASSAPTAPRRGSGGRRPYPPRPRGGPVAGVATCAAEWPMPWTPPGAPAHRRAATTACSGRLSPRPRGAASGRGRSRPSAGATTHGPAPLGTPAGRTPAGHGRRGRGPTTACAGSGPRPVCAPVDPWRVAPRVPPTLHARHAGPHGRCRPHAPPPSAQRFSPIHPQGWGQPNSKGVRRAVRAARWAVVFARHHQRRQSYPQYPQPCSQVLEITRTALTWPLAEDDREYRRPPQSERPTDRGERPPEPPP
jgi:hypothetical protein